jgi:hypothetical protein
MRVVPNALLLQLSFAFVAVSRSALVARAQDTSQRSAARRNAPHFAVVGEEIHVGQPFDDEEKHKVGQLQRAQAQHQLEQQARRVGPRLVASQA